MPKFNEALPVKAGLYCYYNPGLTKIATGTVLGVGVATGIIPAPAAFAAFSGLTTLQSAANFATTAGPIIFSNAPRICAAARIVADKMPTQQQALQPPPQELANYKTEDVGDFVVVTQVKQPQDLTDFEVLSNPNSPVTTPRGC